MIQSVSRSTQAPALEYLSRAPYLNVFLSHVLSARSRRRPREKTSSSRLIAIDVLGVGYLRASARTRRRAGGDRGVCRARKTPSRRTHDRRLARHGSRVLGARTRLARRAAPGARPSVRHAARPLAPSPLRAPRRPFAKLEPRNGECVADSSAQMVRQELGYDPRRGSTEFGEAIRQMIERKLWWVGSANGRICFFCHVGPWSERTIQLQGIWTPPELRGPRSSDGGARRDLRPPVRSFAELSLYVNDFNEAAIALYRRVGFEHVGDFQTLLF